MIEPAVIEESSVDAPAPPRPFSLPMTPSTNGAAASNGAAAAVVVGVPSSTRPRTTCPRCREALRIIYHEPSCLKCGYADYAYTPPQDRTAPRSLVSAGTEYVLRYFGDSPALAETLTYAKAVRHNNRVLYAVTCPFCTNPMVQASQSGKRREVREERYKCEEGHRVSLAPSKNGGLGWK